jgi:nucleoside-diphosphate-sugar epimerase
MRYIVTGGAGFLGSHLCDYLIDRDDKVLCLDNYTSGSINNVKHLLTNINFGWKEWNVSNYLDVQRIDGIFHLASITDPVKCKNNVVATLEANIQGTLNLLKLSKNLNIPLLFASSIRVLDSGSNGCYIEGKRVGEILCNEYGAKIARMGNVYGPRMDKQDGRVIPTFIRKSLQNETIKIWGDGSQLDSFCYYSDIVDGLCRFMDSSHSGVIEFGSSEVINISDLAKLVLKECNSKSSISFTNDKMDSIRKIVDISEAEKLLNWSPKINISQGLKRMIEEVKIYLRR